MASYIIMLGFDNIVSMITPNLTPLFIWFLGSFAFFPELNEQMLPYYQHFFINGALSKEGILQKYGFDSLSILAKNSIEMRNFLIRHQSLPAILSNPPVNADCLNKMFLFISVLLDSPESTLLGNPTVSSLLKMAFSPERIDNLLEALEILLKFLNLGMINFLVENSFDEALFILYKSNIPFQVRKKIMSLICKVSTLCSTELKIKYILNGLPAVLTDAIEEEDEIVQNDVTDCIDALSKKCTNM
ncbi:uncharacterized protein GO595_004023 [Histomonas meleagridis]|uniref:uncharacterized protein n=1 Tax=Histomonas meleagridis TaxID=135588 RepID=UPI003559BD52|nr:hypothetical protein GO595_004023 [Histomonas meleagridis]